MKTKEELNALKEEVETLSKKLTKLNEDELAQVIGGVEFGLTSEYDGAFPPTEKAMPSLGNGFINAPNLPEHYDDPDLAGRNTTVST